MNTPRNSPFQTITFALIIIGILALALGGYLTPVFRYVLTPILTVQEWLSTRFLAFQDFLSTPGDLALLRQENAELESEIAHLRTQFITLQQQVTEVEILSALLDFARAHPEYEYQGAAVIARDTSPFLKYVFINRGSDDGLRRGMPVVTDQGLIGRIGAVTANAARVQLITDPGSNVNVRIQPADVDAVLVGSITNEITIEQIPQDSKIQSGNIILTSGLGGNYPQNILIGQITSVREQATALFKSATVQSVIDFNRVEIVLVIVNFNPIDITPLLPENNVTP
jgi:rod shape-determining protein MreC